MPFSYSWLDSRADTKPKLPSISNGRWCCLSIVLLLPQARTEKERKKFRELYESKRAWSNLFTVGFLVNLALFVAALYLFSVLIQYVGEDHEIAQFDPYSILGIETGADGRAIKRAYRKQSLMYHPDKNPGDSAAADKFLKIAKAYEALTDEAARQNWEKFGNPDGRQALELSIGLPTFLLEEGNYHAVLIFYLIVLVVVIPSLVACYYNKSRQYGDKLVMFDTYRWFYARESLSEHTHSKMLPDVLAMAAEFKDTPIRPASDEADLASLQAKLKRGEVFKQARYTKYSPKPAQYVKASLLLHGHLYARQLELALTPAHQADLQGIIKVAPRLIDAMIDVAASRRWMQTVISIIEFSQQITQGLSYRDSCLLQLPHFTDKEVKHCASGKGKHSGNQKNLAAFINMMNDPDVPMDEKKGVRGLGPAEQDDVASVVQGMPDLKVEVTLGIDNLDEEDVSDICEGDVVTIAVKLTRRNVPEGDGHVAGLVYSQASDFEKKEIWWILVGNVHGNDRPLLNIAKVTGQGREEEEKIQFLAPAPGKYEFEILIKSDSYMGLDQKQVMPFEVKSRDILPEYVVHEEDQMLDNEPTLWDAFNDPDDEEDSDWDDEDDEDGAAGGRRQQGGGRVARPSRPSRPARGDGGEDGEDGDGDDRPENEEEDGDWNQVEADDDNNGASSSGAPPAMVRARGARE